MSNWPAETMPLRTVAPANSAIILAAASRASLTVATLMPFSKREDDSERRLRRPLVLRIDLPLKTAASRTTRVDFSEISVASPPMTPARATGLSATVITRSLVSNSRSSPSKVTNFSPARASRTRMSFPSKVSKSKACMG